MSYIHTANAGSQDGDKLIVHNTKMPDIQEHALKLDLPP